MSMSPMSMSPMSILAAVTVRIRRGLVVLHRWWWVAIGALAGLAGWGVTEAIGDAAAAQEAWGTPVPVVIVRDDVAAGEPIDVDIRTVPSAVVPADGLIAGAASPVGTDGELVANHSLAAGEMLVAGDVERRGVVGRLPDGWRAITVLEHRPSGAAIGERVDVVGDGLVIASGAEVIDVVQGEQLVTLAVEASAAPAVAAADIVASITLLRRP